VFKVTFHLSSVSRTTKHESSHVKQLDKTMIAITFKYLLIVTVDDSALVPTG
jgi:hypothetical protein